METIHRERLEKLVNFLEELPEEQFYFGLVIQKWNEARTCGTVGCALGWTPKLFPDLVGWDQSTYSGLTICDDKAPNVENVVYHLFGKGVDPEYFLPYNETEAFFEADEGEETEFKHYLHKDSKPKEVAALLKKIYL